MDTTQKLSLLVKRKEPGLVRKVLEATVGHGEFGMSTLDKLRDELPETSCDNCGKCCNSISILSIEHHRLIRQLMTTLSPGRLTSLILSGFDFKARAITRIRDKRMGCLFRDDEKQLCLVYPARHFGCRIFGICRDENGKPDCEKVIIKVDSGWAFSDGALEKLMTPAINSSESFLVYPDRPESFNFPFEFWLIRYSLGPEAALQIYRESMIPLSTPLINLWSK